MGDLIQISFHHVGVSGLDQELFTVSDRLENSFIILLLLDNLFFAASLFTNIDKHQC